jgi:hypothetical protein
MKKILVIADSHCGGRRGMLPPNYYYPDRDLHLEQSRVQEFTYERWHIMCKTIGHVDAVICNGDMVEGLNRKGGGIDILVPDIMVQCDIGRVLLNEIDTDRFIFIQGSKYHVDDNPSADEMLCKMMNGEWYGFFGDVMFDNITFNLQHYGPPSNRNSGGFTSMIAGIDELRLDGDECDIYIKSHTHMFKYAGGSNYLVVTTPCWKSLDDYCSTKNQKRPDNGYILFNVEGSDYSWDYNIFKVPKYFFSKYKNY